jgi:hypothetical protein
MLKKKALVAILVAGILIFATNVFALSPGTPFSYIDIVFPGATDTWTHNITNFFPSPSGSEQLIINSGYLLLNLTFTPAWFPLVGGGGFYSYSGTPSLDGYYIVNTFNYGSTTPGPVIYSWLTPITSQFALNAIADKTANIILTSTNGNLNSVNISALYGGGTVAPEPVSMLLVGAGLAGLPAAKRFRRFMRKGS